MTSSPLSRESDALLRSFFEHAPSLMGVVELTQDGDILHIADNVAACRFFGVAPKSTSGKTSTQLNATPQAIRLWRSKYLECAERGGPVRFEHFYEIPGGPQWLSVVVAPVVASPEGEPRYSYICENISARKHAERMAQEAEQRATMILESVTDAFLAVDRRWHFSYANPEAGRVLRQEPSSLLGRSFWEVFPRFASVEFEQAFTRTMDESIPCVLTLPYLDADRYYEVRAYPALTGISVYLRDVTSETLATHARHRLMVELQTSEARYRALFTSIDQGFCIIEVLFDEQDKACDYRFLEANDVFQKHAGFHAAPGRTMREIVPNIEERWIEIYAGVAQRRESLRVVEESKALGRWFDVYAFSLSHGDHLVGILFSDITDGRRAEQVLAAIERRERERAEELEALMRAVPAAIWIAHDADCRRIEGNPQSYRLLRMREGTNVSASDADAAAGRPFREFRNGAEIPPDQLPIQVAARTKQMVRDAEITLVFDDGTVRHTFGTATPLLRKNGEVRGVISAFVDITPLKEATAELQRRQRELQTLADNSPDILARFDRNLCHLFVNAAIESLTGRARGDFLGKSLREWGMSALTCEQWEAALSQVFQERQASNFEFSFDSPGGSRWFSARLLPECLESGEVLSVLSVTHDRTREKLAEEALRENARRKDEFLAMLAHELRNPLAPLRTGLDVLRTATNDAETAARTRGVMERQIRQLVRVVDDLLDVSRISTGKLELKREQVDVRGAIEQAVEASRPAIDAGSHTLVIEGCDEPMPAFIDAARIAQVVTNLLNNAAKYTPAGGRIDLRVQKDGPTLLIRVKDNGFGIPSEMLQQVFDMFTQVDSTLSRAQRGLGIGLSLVKTIVNMHSGQVFAESPGPGAGSTFTIHLPMREGDTMTANSLPAEPPKAPKAMRILVVDDNEDAADMLAMMLELSGYTSKTESSAARALKTARTFAPHVAFLDIGLPDMTGYELARQFKEDPQLRAIKLVALTGWGSAEDKRKAASSGFDAHLTKPVDATDVTAVVAEYASQRAIQP